MNGMDNFWNLFKKGTPTLKKRMDNEKLVRNWHRSILKECRTRLGRDLTAAEETFITSRGGFMALEMIEETVKSLSGKELERYLNSEARK